MRLRVSIGSNKNDLQTAWVNVDDKPTEVNTQYWVGRVLVRVKDFDGYTPDGSPPATHSDYFEGRNRRFHIQAEGRFKKQYNGDQIWFGTQFDHMIGNFPETLFNAGMRIAKYIDPAVFYDKHSATPYIMSPYVACVNTLSAWPAPFRSHDAVLALENGNALTDSDDEHPEDEVPRELVGTNKKSPPKPIRYWSFQGFREDEISNTLQRKPTRDSLLQEQMHTINEETAREGSIATQSTKFDEDRMVTAEHPTHRIALARLGSHGRNLGFTRTSPPSGSNTLGTFAETLSEDDYSSDDGNASFYTAAEYIIEDEVQPDGSIVPVKKAKKGLSVKKVRKSLHIPSAKTVQKNMRGLSIKRKEKVEKVEKVPTDPDFNERGRDSIDAPHARKSLDLMRPFRFGHHDKESSSHSRKSSHIDRDSTDRSSPTVVARNSMSQDRDFTSSKISSKNISTTTAAPQPPATSSSLFSPADSFRGDPVLVRDGTQPKSATSVVHQNNVRIPDESGPLAIDRAKRSSSGRIDVQSSASESGSSRPHRHDSAQSTARTIDSDSKHSDATIMTRYSEDTEALQRPSTMAHSVTRKDTAQSASIPEDGLSHKLDEELGPWRFSDPKIEPIEDTAFIFGDTSHSVKDRRKHFAKSADNRQEFEFDPDIVYCMSFFLPYMNFNTFDLKLGPLGANLHKYVDDQPVRYMARSADRPDEVFFMVEFSLE